MPNFLRPKRSKTSVWWEIRHVPISPTIPIYVVYLTSWVTPAGVVNFRPDIYGRDARLR
jgi:murein L,D-transpeptidase YcbB/YkuD